ncbi:hypothetical protein [Mucilaginibacter sp.]|jgi:hypothetical protein|uniref:hypothetical protein n=1 Tax=Mucilaginibacter sp. TaxID=1882438 RepID=UPI002C0DFA69|nr:hypothetical protein [Mucilaginibacter sp.]HTI58067.1 hypothetical protein [Mucilaginibacter sp.]
MKKVIFAALLMASIGTLSSFKADTSAVKHDTVADKKELGTADDKKELGTADDKKELGTADAHKRSTLNDKKELGTAD